MKNRSLLPTLLSFCRAVLPVLLLASMASAQDTIVFEKRYEYLAHVLQDSGHEVVYRKFQDKDSLVFTIHKNFITEIRYQNRRKEWKKNTLVDLAGFSKPLDAWVIPTDTAGIFRGTLYGFNDSTLFLKKKVGFWEDRDDLNSDFIYVFPYKRVHIIELKRQNQVGQYATWGAIGGFALGTLTGLFIFKDAPPCDPLLPDSGGCDESLASPRTRFEKSLLLGLGTGAGGFLGGGIYGSVRVKIPIGGKLDVFNQSLPKLKRMARAN